MRSVIALMTVFMAAWVQADLVVEQGYVRGLPPGQANTAAFMTLINTGEKYVEIIAVGADVADKAELHTSSEQDGMVHMEKLDGLGIEAGQSVSLKPGSHHLMLLGLYNPLAEGDNVKLRFSLSDGSQYATILQVRSVLNESNEHQHH